MLDGPYNLAVKMVSATVYEGALSERGICAILSLGDYIHEIGPQRDKVRWEAEVLLPVIDVQRDILDLSVVQPALPGELGKARISLEGLQLNEPQPLRFPIMSKEEGNWKPMGEVELQLQLNLALQLQGGDKRPGKVKSKEASEKDEMEVSQEKLLQVLVPSLPLLFFFLYFVWSRSRTTDRWLDGGGPGMMAVRGQRGRYSARCAVFWVLRLTLFP